MLTRPIGLAGWALPTVAVDGPTERWSPRLGTAARQALGAEVDPIRRLAPDAWLVRTTGRIPAAGVTWIAAHEAGRAGGDADLIREALSGLDD